MQKQKYITMLLLWMRKAHGFPNLWIIFLLKLFLWKNLKLYASRRNIASLVHTVTRLYFDKNFYAAIIRDKMINRCTNCITSRMIGGKYRSIFKIAQGSVAKRVLSSLLLSMELSCYKICDKIGINYRCEPKRIDYNVAIILIATMEHFGLWGKMSCSNETVMLQWILNFEIYSFSGYYFNLNSNFIIVTNACKRDNYLIKWNKFLSIRNIIFIVKTWRYEINFPFFRISPTLLTINSFFIARKK